MKNEKLKDKSSRSEGLSKRCSTCCFRTSMVGPDMKVSEICKVCGTAYREGYEKGYKSCKRKD